MSPLPSPSSPWYDRGMNDWLFIFVLLQQQAALAASRRKPLNCVLCRTIIKPLKGTMTRYHCPGCGYNFTRTPHGL